MLQNENFDTFNAAMDTILKANPAAVKAAMEADKEDREKRRKSKKSSADRASNASNQKAVSPTLPVTSA